MPKDRKAREQVRGCGKGIPKTWCRETYSHEEHHLTTEGGHMASIIKYHNKAEIAHEDNEASLFCASLAILLHMWKSGWILREVFSSYKLLCEVFRSTTTCDSKPRKSSVSLLQGLYEPHKKLGSFMMRTNSWVCLWCVISTREGPPWKIFARWQAFLFQNVLCLPVHW